MKRKQIPMHARPKKNMAGIQKYRSIKGLLRVAWLFSW
jgi:hypothetical protein